jgi:hypothetical protein
VPEHYTTTRTAYRTECKQEAYTAYRCVWVPQTRTRVVTRCNMVPSVETRCRTVCTMVPTVEHKVVCKRHYSYVTETHMACRTVDHGHYECKEVPCCWKSMCNHMRHMCHRHDCCEEECPPPTRTVKCWVPCLVTEQYPVTKCRKVCTVEQVTVPVTVCRPVYRQETYQVTVCRPVPVQHTETYTVCVPQTVPYQAYRTVRVCVPYQETVTSCRMVPRVVTRQVPAPVAECCSSPCCEEAPRCCHRHHGHRHHDCCD